VEIPDWRAHGEVRETASRTLASGARDVTLDCPVMTGLPPPRRPFGKRPTSSRPALDGGRGALMKDLDADRLILATGARDELRDREWVKGLGLDPRPDQIPSLSELLRT
jgi:hypothetical protein